MLGDLIMNFLLYLFAIAIGIITGGITSLIGASGVMVIVPVLTMFFQVSTHSAIGTSLFVDVIASLVVSYAYFKNGNIDFKSSIWITISSIAGAQLGTQFASQIEESSLSALFGIVLIAAGIGLLIKSYKKNSNEKESPKKKIRFNKQWQQISALIVIGFGIGIISGVFGAGGGVMILLALIMILEFPLHKAIGTSTLIMTVTALSSTIGYASRGNINYELGCLLSVGAVIGGILGARYANKVNGNTLQKVVSICFMCLGVVMTIMEIVK